MFEKFYERIKHFIKEEYKFIIFLVAFYIFCMWPMNYYIITGGGISDIDERIQVTNSYESKGSFSISYVSELKGTLASYLLSYVMPDWKRVDMNDYKYEEEEDYEDIEFRSDLDLASANSNAIYYAYTLAGKEIKLLDTNIFVIALFEEFKNPLEIGDEIISIDGRKLTTMSEYQKHLQTVDSDLVSVVVKRDGKEKTLECRLYLDEEKKVLGVALQSANRYKTNPKVNIKFKRSESGPSAGLITTLDIYNKLTKKDITHAKKIAGTGTIDADGSIGEIGEVKYKLLGAVKEGADIFLSPAGSNYETCKKVIKEKKLDIQLIEVHNIEEAIEKLNKLES